MHWLLLGRPPATQERSVTGVEPWIRTHLQVEDLPQPVVLCFANVPDDGVGQKWIIRDQTSGRFGIELR
jgi:hypothetical protein